jgi:glucose/arabinose dehydrogenase
MTTQKRLTLKQTAVATSVLFLTITSVCAQSPLRRYEIKPSDLPPPNPAEDAVNPPRVVPRPAGAQLIMPPGFSAETFAEGEFVEPRWLALAPNGDVFLSDARAGKIIILRDANKDGVAEQRFTFVEGMKQPFGMAFWKNYLYIGNTDAVIRFTYKPGQTKAEGTPEKIADLPGKGYREHWTRNILFSRDGKKLYVTVGSETNVSVEKEEMRAAIIEFNPDGTGKRIYASGVRNPIGLAWLPGTRTLWAAVQERDRLGDDLVPDFVTEIKDGGFYGWPYAYMGIEDPRRKGESPELVKRTLTGSVLIESHSAVLGLAFNEGRMFPSEYRGDAFVALHGSWNRSKRTGYKIIRIRFKNGKLVNSGYEDFLVGWMTAPDRREVWGRPVGLLFLQDGSLLITDDGANKIWRVSYRAK